MPYTNFRSAMKKNSLVFFTYKKLTDNFYRLAVTDYLIHNKAKTRDIIRDELDLIRRYWNCDPMHYYSYRLFEKQLSQEELLDYVPPYLFYNFYVPSIYDDVMIRKAASKININEYFISRGISTPDEVAVIIKGRIIKGGVEISYGSFTDILKNSRAGKFFMKPDLGKGGKGIQLIEKAGKALLINKKELSEKVFRELAGKNDFIVQESLVQRKDIAEIYPGSVNTLRVITQNFNSAPRIPVITLRMGRNGAFVDNCSSGGISLGVDPETGQLDKYAIDTDNNVKFDSHPDTGIRFEGFIIKDWQKIRNRILEFAQRTSEFPDVGWDIAIVENGITAIEFNLNYGLDMQGVVGGMRRLLNIDPSNLNRHRILEVQQQ